MWSFKSFGVFKTIYYDKWYTKVYNTIFINVIFNDEHVFKLGHGVKGNFKVIIPYSTTYLEHDIEYNKTCGVEVRPCLFQNSSLWLWSKWI